MTLKDLKFRKHMLPDMYDKHAMVLFPNGYGVSIITGKYAYSDEEHPYELAVIKTEDEVPEIINGVDECDKFETCLNYDYTDGDVKGYLTEDKVNKWLREIENLEKQKEN